MTLDQYRTDLTERPHFCPACGTELYFMVEEGRPCWGCRACEADGPGYDPEVDP